MNPCQKSWFWFREMKQKCMPNHKSWKFLKKKLSLGVRSPWYSASCIENEYRISAKSFLHWTVLNSFRSLLFSLHKGEIITTTIWNFLYNFKDSKKDSFRGNYLWIYGYYFFSSLQTFIKEITYFNMNSYHAIKKEVSLALFFMTIGWKECIAGKW